MSARQEKQLGRIYFKGPNRSKTGGRVSSKLTILHLVRSITEFKELGVEFLSLTESIDTSTAAGKLLFDMLCALAEFDHDLISERVRAGIARAKKQGVKFGGGRRRLVFDRQAVRQMHAEGATIREIQKRFKLSIGTVHRTLATAQEA
jgi:DNA invertase Pin-like site-specific DNA recombinase